MPREEETRPQDLCSAWPPSLCEAWVSTAPLWSWGLDHSTAHFSSESPWFQATVLDVQGMEEKKVHALWDHSRKEVKKKKKKNPIKGLIGRQTIYWPQIRGRRRDWGGWQTLAEGSHRLPGGLFQPFPKIPATPTWVQRNKARPQGIALVTLKIIMQRRQRKRFPVSHRQGVWEVSFYLSYSIGTDVQVKFT